MPTIYISDTGFKEMLKFKLQYQKAGGDKVQPHFALPHKQLVSSPPIRMKFENSHLRHQQAVITL
jgi:hypothetical protein